MVAVRHAAIWHRLVHALGGEADADELLRRSAAVTPQAAALAGAREVVLARPRLPGPRPCFELADLHHPWFLVAKADAPVVGVGSEIEQAATGREIVLGRVHHPLRVVLVVRAVQDNPVRFQRGHAFPVQIFVGQDVVVVFHCLQPGDDRQVGRKLPRRAEPRRAIFRPEVDDRTAVGGVADACAVVVLVVGRETELDVVLVDLDIDLLEDRRLGRDRLQRRAIECGADIGVGKIARCRDQQADRRPRASLGRTKNGVYSSASPAVSLMA